MTNTLHRQGAKQALQGDYVIFAHTTQGITRDGSAPKLKEFMRICLKHDPVSMGAGRLGNIFKRDNEPEKLITKIKDGSTTAAVFTHLETLRQVVEELIRADLGLSINVSGLLEGTQECCRKSGIMRHSAEQSLGFWGDRERLPEREILEFNTLCGHGMVSFNLIRKMIEYVRLRRLTPKKAAMIMAKCCECGVFNPLRAEKMLEQVRKEGYLKVQRRE